MSVFRKILIAMIFVCLVVGGFLAIFSKTLVSKKRNTEEVANRKALKIKLIGYVFLMASIAFAIFQSLLS